MVAFNTVKAGDKLYDAGTYRMGNTTRRAIGNWEVRILEVDVDGQRVFASWNGNKARWFPERTVKAWRRTPKAAPLIKA
jgi:hypothetical protein